MWYHKNKIQKRLLFLFLAFLFIIQSVLLKPLTVQAGAATDKHRPIQHLCVVSDCDWFLSELKSALQAEEAKESGSNLHEYDGKEFSDHKFVKWGGSGWVQQIENYISSLDEPLHTPNVAVVFFLGMEEVDDFETFTHETLKKVEENAWQQEMVEEPVLDEDGNDTGETKSVQKDSNQKQYHYEKGENETHHKKKAQIYNEELEANGLNAFLSSKKVNSYFVGMGPGKGYDEEKYTELTDADGHKKSKADLWGFWAKKWNESLSAAGRVIDIWDTMCEEKPYFSGTTHMVGSGYHGSKACGGETGVASGVWTDADTNHGLKAEESITTHVGDIEYNESDAGAAGVNAYRFDSYDEQTYQTMFHIVFNHVRLLNPAPEAGEAVQTGMYGMSASLTAYVNHVLSPNAEGEHKDHKLFKVGNSGNAGALLGYGDKEDPYGFEAYVTQKLSSTSSTVSYEALKKQGGAMNDALMYARYGRLLSDMGLDKYGMKHTVGSGRLVTGVVMMLAFALSMMCSKLYGLFIDLMILLNPFRFFTAIGGEQGAALLDVVKDNDTMGAMAKTLTETDAMKSVTNLVSGYYKVLQSWSWGITIPFSLALLIVSLFLSSKLFHDNPQERVQKILSWLLRVAFVAIGIPMLGITYTSLLNDMDVFSDDTKCASTQLVASTFVDFGEWGRQLRLDPVSGGLFVSENSDTDIGGSATVETQAALRQTALAINKKTGVVPGGISTVTGATDNEAKFAQAAFQTGAENSNEAINACWSLLTGYMTDNFYYASDWESEVGSKLQEMANDGRIELGRRKGPTEDAFDSDQYQGDKTVYQMLDETNETEDWKGRSTEDSEKIFTDSTKWKKFNMFNNGKKLTNSGANARKVTYIHSYSGSKLGTDPSAKGALSTLSMYNYLSSRFNANEVVMYSNSLAVNISARYAHYSVNSIGSGAQGILYYLNALVIMGVISVIGVCYVMGAAMTAIKKGCTVLIQLPAASLGAIKAIATILTTVLTMIIQIVTIGVMYTLVNELLVVFVQVLQGLLTGGGSNGDKVITILGGISMELKHGNSMIAGLMTDGWIVSAWLLLTLMTAGYGCYVLVKYRRAVKRVGLRANALVWNMVLPGEVLELCAEYENREGVLGRLRGKIQVPDVSGACRSVAMLLRDGYASA